MNENVKFDFTISKIDVIEDLISIYEDENIKITRLVYTLVTKSFWPVSARELVILNYVIKYKNKIITMLKN